MKKRTIYIGIIAGVIIIILIILASGKDNAIDNLKVEVERGQFEIVVSVTGELQAKSSMDITGPTELRNSRTLRFRDIKIQDLIPEGTVVDSGDYVATLDKSEASNNLKDLEDELEKAESQYLMTQLDTTMQLSELRDQLVNLKFGLEERKIVLEQSKFEPPATIRQAEIDLDKAERSYKQALDNYGLKKQQAKAEMKDATLDLNMARRKFEEMRKVIDKFVIFAPQSGMVIYKKEWSGQKREVGSTISPWDLTVATLPDLSEMTSKTYVNEVDISKVDVGQEVRVGIDAFPERKYTGEVVDVANIGEQLPNADAKVFEVLIRVNETDTVMRPAMTTSNQIVTRVYDDVLYLPLEAVHSNDSLSFVYTTNKKKQIVILGATNENFVIIEQGLKEGDEVFLSVPEEADELKYSGLELITVIKERERQKQLEKERMEEERKKREADKEKKNSNRQGNRVIRIERSN